MKTLSPFQGKLAICIGLLDCAHDFLITIRNRTKRIKYLEENLGSLNITLTPEEVKEIRDLCDAREVAGGLSPIGSVFH